MGGVLSTSIIESFSFNIAEGMACGCRPYIYNWEGAEKIWGKEWIFHKMPKFVDTLTEEDMKAHRKYVVDNYDFNLMMTAIVEIAGEEDVRK